ncbi:hypothetical protein CRU99_07595 [Malaciobacter mytili]|uniref:DUF3649 domain-containing protein n=1 Tax=Malaciobacter mytili LMG 24559 TaxID=1032238 RepID=A0AAX2AL80_9BACT|nr:hypothetical protein CRU99_07595 [Malaciobacter mytili]RXK16501.1 hypothetical protein CP985_03150 [Malaciobacter mytili LMG 24559]
MNRFFKIYKELSIVENSGKKIGLFRTICSIFGGLLVAYLAMTLLVFIIPGSAGESIIVPLMFNTFAWAIASLWICLSISKLVALKRVLIPTFILTIAITIFIVGN